MRYSRRARRRRPTRSRRYPVIEIPKGKGKTTRYDETEVLNFRAAIRAFEIPLEVVNPKTWQPVFLKGRIGGGGGNSNANAHKKALKNALYDVATRIFPDYATVFRGPKGGLKDGRVDAALIAEFGRRSFSGQLHEISNA